MAARAWLGRINIMLAVFSGRAFGGVLAV